MGNKSIYVLYAAVALFLGYSLVNNLRLLLKARSNLSIAQQNLEEETEKNKELNRELSDAQKTIYIERVARDTLGLAQEGEITLVLPPQEELRKLSPRIFKKNRGAELEETPNWQKWLQLFM